MSDFINLRKEYYKSVEDVAKKVWHKYPKVVAECLADSQNYVEKTLKEVHEAQNYIEPLSFWYDPRLPIMAFQAGDWPNHAKFFVAPTKHEQVRMKAFRVPKIFRWLTPTLVKSNIEELKKLSILHKNLSETFLVEEKIKLSAKVNHPTESYDPAFGEEWIMESDIEIDGAGWIESEDAIDSLGESIKSEWATDIVCQNVIAPYSIRVSIRNYVNAIDQIQNGTHDLKLAKLSIQEALNIIHSEYLMPLRFDIFYPQYGLELSKTESLLWAKYLMSSYQRPGPFTIWQDYLLENKLDDYLDAKKKFIQWARQKSKKTYSSDYEYKYMPDPYEYAANTELDLDKWVEGIKQIEDGREQNEFLANQLLLNEFNEQSKEIKNLYDEGKVNLVKPKLKSVQKLDNLIGIEPIKKYVQEIINMHEINSRRKAQGLPELKFNKHLALTGNPGTGKTTVARILGEIYKELGILSKGHFIEAGQDDLVANYVGQTSKKTAKVVESAKGGVLFIDEAYSLSAQDRGGFGAEAIEVLVKEMENNRDDFVLIVAGYQAEMENFLNSNAGLKGRFSKTITFPDMSNDQLTDVAIELFKSEKFVLSEEAKLKLSNIFKSITRTKGFANARLARQLVENIKMNQASRLINDSKAPLHIIIANDVVEKGNLVVDDEIKEKNKIRLNNSLEKLQNLTGLSNIKSEIDTIISLARIARIKQEKGQVVKPVIGHFVFSGSPGTGKTTVARLIGEIFASLGLLPSGHTVEVGRADLIGEYIGQTAPKVKNKVEAALGGVLFIDEAYSLNNESNKDFGKEAVETLVQLMENHRDNLVIVFAGYKEEMKNFVQMNSGLKSRISYSLDFKNYDGKESLKIFEDLIKENNYIIDQKFKDKAKEIIDLLVNQKSFSNGRTIRELFENTQKIQAKRFNTVNSALIKVEDLNTLKAEDLPKIEEFIEAQKAKIGFAP